MRRGDTTPGRYGYTDSEYRERARRGRPAVRPSASYIHIRAARGRRDGFAAVRA